ncbi:BTAD domain-containing putative transcriptional regulator, partial [Mycobacterium sp. 1165178.9]|uniref:BTAD domain-containing putative transcriptional regulator n=1 Tax=Mycobacterium sp. 1165178.9 TaxID=1834070 RepID=UPI0007FBA182
MLGLHGGSVVSAHTLVELLWGEDPPRTAVKALQTHISALRRTLGDGFVLTEGAGWTLAESEVDASLYTSAARSGREAAAAGDNSQAVTRFEEALALWRGIPELPDGRRGTSEKTRWIEGHATLIEDRAEALLATGRAAEVIGDLEAAVADAPLRERRWGQLMLALYRAGRQGEALAAFQRARSLLAAELGVDPGPNLRKLEAAIVAQDASLDIAVAQQAPSVTRAVTFLLTDIEGSTAAWEADADAMAVALARHDELIEQVVTSQGGRLIKTRGEGDATFSVFERPSAAAAAAIELQEAIGREPWSLREPLRIRMALHTGEVELRDGDYFGRAVNRVARLRSLAVGGQILCSGATAELVIDSLRDDVVLTDLGMRELRNLARPEHVFELRLQTADDHRQAVPPDTPLERPSLPAVLAGPGPFVGREHEFARLFAAWQTSLVGATNAVLIAGEPGVGKTRLAGEWSRQAYDQGALVIYGRCDEDLGAPYQPFAEALRALVPCLGSSRLRGLRGAEALLPLVPGLTDLVPDLAAPARADPDTERYALFDAVVALLGLASGSAPVVLVLDDLHWAAKPTLLLLRHLLRFGERGRVQVLGTYRSTDLDRSHPLAATLADLHRDGTASRIALGGLDEDDVTTYVAEAGYDDEELARALASVTGGNPFFLIEALRHVDESGGHWDPGTLPQGVREAVSRRLTRLPAETNKALAAAAVVGSRFGLELVERVVEADLVDAFDEACKAGIVIEESSGHYRFNHAIVRQSLLAELPSVRRLRLHQRIATTLENEPGADDELLAELAHHYFECAWAGNAAKAVEYCRRAADQAMARLAYEGAADLYDRAHHALEEIDDELPDRDDQVATVLIARCEALLAAGDVASAAGAVAQLQEATRDSARLAAWATCFDGQLSMLVHPERLDEIESAVGAAAGKLAELDDAAGEAMAHTVRATCLARLGRIGDCEIALDDALTAARRAREHRRVNAVLANAPLAALWGPNPVPRAGGRCLDVVRLLRITTDSPAVEATSTRCQAMLEAFRGRAAAARRMIDSARRTVTELGLRHALLEVQQFAGIVELVVGDPVAAEPYLRQAYNGFRRMGLDADTAETAALLGRACLALDRVDEADQLCTESERLAGHALKASIAWRTLRARLLSRGNDHDEARRVAEAAVSLAEHTDALVDHGDACLTLATVLGAAGNVAGARAAAGRAADLYERKGAAALAERARLVLGKPVPTAVAPPEPPAVEIHTPAVQTSERVMAAIHREDWDEFERLFAPDGSIESRRKIVGFKRTEFRSNEVMHQTRRDLETGIMRVDHVVIAVRGERLALARITLGTVDVTAGAPQDELLQLYGIDNEGRITWQVWFDLDDMDAAIAELDAADALQIAKGPPEPPSSAELVNACVRVIRQVETAANREAWDEYEDLYAPNVLVESHRKLTGFTQRDLPSANWPQVARRRGVARSRDVVIAVRGDRLALIRVEVSTDDERPGAPIDEMLAILGIDNEGRIALQVFFDSDDMDAAVAELDARQSQFEAGSVEPDNACVRVIGRLDAILDREAWDEAEELFAPVISHENRRKIVGYPRIDLSQKQYVSAGRRGRKVGPMRHRHTVLAVRGERLAISRLEIGTADLTLAAPQDEMLEIIGLDADGRISLQVFFDSDDMDAAVAELDAAYALQTPEARPEGPSVNACVRVMRQVEVATKREAWDELEELYAPDIFVESRRKITGFTQRDLSPGDWLSVSRRSGAARGQASVIAVRGDRLALIRLKVTTEDQSPGAPVDEMLALLGIDNEGRISLMVWFDSGDMDAAVAELDARQSQFEASSSLAPQLDNAASQITERLQARFAARDWTAVTEMLAEDVFSDDRRRVVNAGIRRGRDAAIQDARANAEVGIRGIASTVIATRGERLVLRRARYSGEAFHTDILTVFEIGGDDRVVARVVFDLDDFAAAIAELDARYLAGEAAPYVQTWAALTGAFAAMNRHELPQLTPDLVNIDHRHGAAFAPGDMTAFVHDLFDDTPNIKCHIQAVHRLSGRGAVITQALHGNSQQGLDAEWQNIGVFTFEGEKISRVEIFDEEDLDAALLRFEELHPQTHPLENAASQVAERYSAHFASRDWDTLGKVLAVDFALEDRRRVVNAGTRHGRDGEIANLRAMAEAGFTHMTSVMVAVRGERLVLGCSSGNTASEEFHNDALGVVEINSDNQIAAVVVFDLDDFDAAVAELDARYLAGEAAAHARTWSLIAQGYAAQAQRELPAMTPDCVTIDHRRAKAFAPGEMAAYIRAGWDLDQTIRTYVEVVHRLNDLGAVCAYRGHGVSQEGFDAEWREIAVTIVEGEMVSRCELFDEVDLDSALTRFEELSRPTPRLENAASKVHERSNACFMARDWAALAETFADDITTQDRRRVIGHAVGHGRDAVVANGRAIIDFGMTNVTSTVVAIRGNRLVLARARYSGPDEQPGAFHTDVLNVVESDADNRIAMLFIFDPDDLGGALAELDARYLAGEAAPYANAWSVIAGGHAALNRRELPPITSDCVSMDHRRGLAFGPGELPAYFHAGFDLGHDIRTYVEVVHRLSNLGAICTHVGHGVSHEGFAAEWRGVDLLTVDGDMVNRCEVFDEADLATALARFDELHPRDPRLENAASRVYERFWTCFAIRDWTAMTEILAVDICSDDRRRVVNGGIRRGRDTFIADIRVAADVGTADDITSTVIATRGERLTLNRIRSQALETELFNLVELDATERTLSSVVVFDIEDFHAALAELDARYLAGEAAAHARTWPLVTKAYTTLNRQKLPPITPDWINIDHRQLALIEAGHLAAYVRDAQNALPGSIYIEAVHRLSDLGAVVTRAVNATSQDGFDAEWREIDVLTFQGDRINRLEVFDETALDAALVHFEKLHPEARQLKSAAKERFLAHFEARDWDAMAEDFAEDYYNDDRRRVVNSGVRRGRKIAVEDLRAGVDVGLVTRIAVDIIATRGERLILTRVHNSGHNHDAVQLDMLQVVEYDADERIAAAVVFDPDDFAAAFTELDARYLAGEAAPHSHAWSVISGVHAAFNKRELPKMPPELLDHRPLVTVEAGDPTVSIRGMWDFTPDLNIYIEAVHRLSNLGAVFTQVSHGTSKEGFAAEWRIVELVTVGGDLVNRGELFEEGDLEAALARFDELCAQARRLENTAIQVNQCFWRYYRDRDWDAMVELLIDDFIADDRRHVINAGVQRGRDNQIADMQALAELDATITLDVIATRGERLVLTRFCSTNRDLEHGEFGVAMLTIMEIGADSKIAATILFDPEDFDAAFEELDSRYLAGEAAAHADTWSVIARMYAAFNQHEIPSRTPDSVLIDHRPVQHVETADLGEHIRALWDVTPGVRTWIEAVHRLSELGVVLTHAMKGTSPEGFDAEWRTINIFTIEGDRLVRCEVFDEADLDAALARFDELHPRVQQLENAASRAEHRFFAYWNSRNWAAMAEILTEDSFIDDTQRNVANVGFWDGRDVVLANMRALVDAAAPEITKLTVIAIRGERLVLNRRQSPNRDPQNGQFVSEGLVVVEIDTDGRIAAHVQFDVDDVDAAFAELDARYLAGEAAPYAHTWSLIADTHATLNRHEIPPIAPGFVNIDHRRGIAFAPGDIVPFVRATFDDTPDVRHHIVAVHRLSDLGAVITQALRGTSRQGVDAEWQNIALFTFEGDLATRVEIFDEEELDNALARFDELHLQTSRLENTAARVNERMYRYFAADDWAAIADIFADNIVYDDRRRVVNGGVWRGRDLVIENMRAVTDFAVENLGLIATRGERLALARWRWSNSDRAPESFHTEVLCLVEVDTEELIEALISFDPEDFNAAFEELDTRYLAGEATAHAQTWSVVMQAYAAANRHELAAISPNMINIDHRSLALIESGDLTAYLRNIFQDITDLNTYLETVHRLTDRGAVVIHVGTGTSKDGFEA